VYASLADVYEWLTPEPLLTPEGNVAAFARWLPPRGRVLDCACGIGLLAVGLARAGYDAHASDISPEMIERTRAHGVDVHARVCAWEDLPATGDFDAVLCVGNSLPHTPNRRAALATMAGALRPGGVLILTSRNWERELAAGTRMEIEDRLVERAGRRALLSHAWTIEGELVRLEVAVSLLAADGTVHTVSEAFPVWPFTHEQLHDDLRAAGLEPQASTYTPDVERYLVTARR